MPTERDRTHDGTEPAAETAGAAEVAAEGGEGVAHLADADAAAGDGNAAASDADAAAGDAGDGAGAGPSGATAVHRTRRFPSLTRDTARPEGGGRAAPGGAPAPARQWPVIAVLAVGALGLLLTAFDLFRAGTLLVGLALVIGAVLRWALPSVGMLAVRSRFTDMVTYGVLGVVIALLAMMVQPDPWLEIPFLDDTLHFTIS